MYVLGKRMRNEGRRREGQGNKSCLSENGKLIGWWESILMQRQRGNTSSEIVTQLSLVIYYKAHTISSFSLWPAN